MIFVPWFGIQKQFRGERTEAGELAAGVLYATLEYDATNHPDANPDMPIVLDCHSDNQRGRAFWMSRGFAVFARIETESGRYDRMRR